MKYLNTIPTRGLNLIKSWLRPGFILLSIFLTLAVGQMWADTNINFSGGYIYFADTYNVHKGSTQLCGRKSNCSNGDWYTAVTTLSNISHTKLYYTSSLEGSGWSNVCWAGWALISNSTAKSNSGTEYWSGSNSTWYSGFSSYGFNSGSTYLITVASSSKGAATTTDYKSSGYSALNNNQTVYKYTSSGGTTPASYTAQNVNSGTVTISAYKMTGNGTASNSSNTGTINTASSTSVYKPAAYTGEVTLTASANAGYSFIGWFESTSATTAISTETSYTYNAPNSTKSIYARFKAEETHDVTVYYKYGSTTVKTATTETAVGVTTEREFTAPVIDGYNFYSYAFGSGLTNKTTTTTNPCRFVTKASGDYELTVNYNIAPVKLLYGSTTPLNSPSNTAMTYDATAKAYYVDVTTNSSPYYFRFDFNNTTQEYAGDWNTYPNVNEVTANGAKVACATEVKGWENKSSLKFTGANGSSIRIWFSYKDKQAWIVETTYTVTVASGGNGTVSPASVTAGKNTSASITATPSTNFVFDGWTASTANITIANSASASTTVKATSAGTVTANFANNWAIKGYGGVMGDWDTWLGLPYSTTNTFSASFTLNKGTTYYFKVVDRSSDTWYGNTSGSGVHTITRASNTKTLSSAGGMSDNISITPDVTGSYTFTFNSSTKNLTVTYPAASPITYSVGTLAGGNAVTVSPSFTSGDYVLRSQAITFTRGSLKAGYTWKGWYSNAAGTGDALGTGETYTSAANTRTNNTAYSFYACYNYANYTVTLNKQTSATGYGTSGSCSNQTVTYNTSLPAISGSMPSGAQGYGFMGFYTATGGGGVQLIDADGKWVKGVAGYTTAAGKWNRTSGCILYAYYKQSEIIDIAMQDAIMDPVPSETGTEADYVIANPVFDPYPSPTVTVEWRMLYSDGISEVPDRTATAYTEGGTKPFQVSFDIVGMVAGVYKIEANLKSSGVVISSYQKVFRIANDYTITIKYMCGEEEIKERITQPGNPVDWQDVTAPDIFGYKFLRWNPGDGITLESANTTKNNRYHAEYDSKLTAYYTKEQYIYLDLSQTFSTDGKWSNPYVYFYSADPWVNNKGAGAKDGGNTHKNYISGHAMTQIDGTDIWYFDYSGVSGSSSYIAFTWGNKTGQENFNATDVIFRGDFSEGTPLFVPATDGAASTRKETVNGAQYYNKGYWVNYVGPKTGYTMLIYNSAGNVELKRELFLSEDKHVPMTASVELDATSTYQIEVYRDNGHYYQHTNGNFTTSSRGPKPLNGSSKLSIKTNAAGSYIFTLGYSSGNLQLSVNYPASMGDFRVTYTDNDTWGRGVAHVARTWIMTSHILPHEANRVDTVSFFISKDHSPEIRWQKITTVAESSVSWGTTTGTCSDWLSDGYTDVTESGVYNFKVTQNADGSQIASIERIGRYEGNYYIRCGALNSKWDHYTTDEDHLMTYSAFSESEENSFGEKYSHYKAKWCERGKNIKFCIANDYSPSISDTLLYDNPNSFDNVESDGRLKTDGSSDPTADRYSANVRFMWNRHTNKISRAYVASATNVTKRFLVLVGQAGLKDKDGNAIPATANLEANAVLLHDDQNWIYETYIRAVPGTLVKLYASYAQASPSPNGAQYFRGIYKSGTFDAESAIQILGGSGSTPQRMRVLYDFKTNRLVTAWLPGATIDGNLEIEADVMIIRDHQKDAECITFANKGSKLSEVKTVYGVLQFNRWTLNNRRRGPGSTIDEDKEHCKDDETISEYHPLLSGEEQLSIHERSQYFISFPFDVNLSDVFGFGTYGEQWIISRYNGLRRAQKGFFADNCFNDDCTNWDYIHSYFGIDHTSFVLKANEGYLLSLDLSQMEYDDTTHFWLNQIHNVELFFPSAVPLAAIENTTATIEALPSTYECKINHNDDGMHPEKDHTKKDSYWRCIGVPSFANYDGSLSNPETSSTIVWQSHPSWEIVAGNLPFLYEWNTTDNSLMPRATSNYNFRSTFSYLVQCSTAIYWSAVVGKKPASIVSRQHEATKEYNWRLTLEKNGEVEDQTFVRMADNEFVTENFDFNQDLVKEEKYNHANIYSFIGTEKVAANSMPLNTENTIVVPLGITLWYDKHAGDYTFALPDGADGIGITLVDSETGTRTNLSAGMDYTVYLEKGNYTNRFYLEIAKIQNVATGTEEIGEPSKSDVRKVMINGILYIVRGDRIYDARGIRVE